MSADESAVKFREALVDIMRDGQVRSTSEITQAFVDQYEVRFPKRPRISKKQVSVFLASQILREIDDLEREGVFGYALRLDPIKLRRRSSEKATT